jgi:hypothetical protein
MHCILKISYIPASHGDKLKQCSDVLKYKMTRHTGFGHVISTYRRSVWVQKYILKICTYYNKCEGQVMYDFKS